ncbi:MAG: hypothetical protein RL461_437 [Planctomycetota bacterium]|jgi:uncharacterized membrane protein/mono/diheme cytochrome c family protein
MVHHGALFVVMSLGLVMAAGGELPAASSLDPWFRLVGRLHPLLVHFPIGLVLAAAAVEGWRWWRQERGLSEFTSVAMLLAAVSAVGAVATGWINAWQEGQDASTTLDLHSWLGTAMAAVLLAAAWKARRRDEAPAAAQARLAPVRVLTVASAFGVGLAGHFGGELVHGDGYVEKALFAALGVDRGPATESAATDAGGATLAGGGAPGAGAVAVRVARAGTVDFRTQVLPIFESRCFECHGNGKRKGGLAMDSAASMTKEDDDGVAVKAGEPDASLIVQRIMLPASDPDSMPPEGERLGEAERELIRTWIKEGGVMEAVAAGIAAAPGAVGDAAPTIDTDLVRRAGEVAQALRARGVIAQPLSQDDPRLDINASLATPPFGDADLAMLAPAAGAIVNLNLSRSQVTDAGIAGLGGFTALEALRLDSTGIGDAALVCVKAMPRLKVLNVHSTKVTDAGLAGLAQAAALERVYAWNSQATAQGAAALQSARPTMRVNVGQE